MSDSNYNHLTTLQSDTNDFQRDLGLKDGISILTGIMIGSGIFYLGSYVLMRSGMSLGLALLCWLIGGLVTLLSGLCYAELGAMLPRAGGSYVYLREAFSPALAFMSGFSSLLLSGSGSIAGLAIAFASMTNSLFPNSPFTTWQEKALAIGAIIFLTILNRYGVKLGALIQNIFTFAKLIPIIIIICLGLLTGTQQPDISILSTVTSISLTNLLSMIALGVVATLWAYEGWVNLNSVSEEIREPRKNLPMAIIFSILGVMVIYFLFNLAIYRVLPFDFISQELETGNLYLGTAAAQSLLGENGRLMVSLGMLVAVFGSLNGCILVFPRSYYAMAKEGALFNNLGKLHHQYKTPNNALWVSMSFSILLVLARDLNQLTNLVVFSGMIYKTLTFYAVIKLRKRYPELSRPYKVTAYPYTVYLTIAIMIALMLNTLYNDPFTSILGLIVPLIGYVIYFLNKHFSEKNLIVSPGD